MGSAIVILPAFWATYLAVTRSAQWAFVHAYLPILLWFPYYFQWDIPVIPNPSFAEAAIIPLMLLFISRGMPGWKFSLTDVLVFSLVLLTCLSEYHSYGYKLAQNLMATMILSVLFPYILAKSIESAGLRIDFAKVIVIVLAIISFLLLLEMVTNPKYTLWQRFLGSFFGSGWTRDIETRWGFTRAEGPFGHSIYAGLIMFVGFRLQRWLEWNQAWPAKMKWLPRQFPPAKTLTLILLLGAIAPLARAPWLSAILTAIIIFVLAIIVSWFKQPSQRFLVIATLFIGVIVSGLVAKTAFEQFVSVGREEALESSRERQTIAYRFELYTTYGEIILDKWVLGWGRKGWPQDKAQWSIDNTFLLLALNHGLIAVVCLLLLFLYLPLRLFFRVIQQPATAPPNRGLDLTLFGILIGTGFCLATVALGGAHQTLLFVLFGWTDAYLHTSPTATRQVSMTIHSNPLPFQFRRVM